MMTPQESLAKFPKGTKVKLSENGRKAYRYGGQETMTVKQHFSMHDVQNRPIPMLRVGYADVWGRKKTRDLQAALCEVDQ